MIGSDSCVGANACNSIAIVPDAPAASNMIIGSNSCVGIDACMSIKVNVVDSSCTDDSACSSIEVDG